MCLSKEQTTKVLDDYNHKAKFTNWTFYWKHALRRVDGNSFTGYGDQYYRVLKLLDVRMPQ